MQLDDKNAVIDGGGGAIGGAVVRAFARQGARTAPTAAALAATLGLAAAAWVVAVRQMDGMDMGVATELGSLAFFVAAWVPMMAAMMLPARFRQC
jgi:NAD(P)-dependent dehydrogenase (short-subunit alcohol dehydrogenase family)